MQFSSLPQDTQNKLNAEGLYLKRLEQIEDEPINKINDAIRLDSAADALFRELEEKEYIACRAEEWFEFCTKNMPDEEALRFANEALNSSL
ncbi:MAG: hypothetical protein UT24_C0034G0004 [Candidatus Woesebacteria bacterium GW2011_GWB1_39_12]|uniref:Uncharacterized protein n=1 Tax=Candidatus Woesebacteria bacterium GW2011_GWB1_39_12 TaxID=1618574 RepID=A0A0G0QAW1_9BACT|nr:MAG: hypothetical protein UT24_C0034G0004 [Candidatus Woesebacteria bacterium GW2011_GWB1_39_12]